MITKEITVTNPKGIHARPATMLVQTASQYSSEITLVKEDTRADARSVLDILSLDCPAGTKLLVQVQGSDENEALEAIEKVFQHHFL